MMTNTPLNRGSDIEGFAKIGKQFLETARQGAQNAPARAQKNAEMYAKRYQYFFFIIPGWALPGLGIWYAVVYSETFSFPALLILTAACGVIGAISFISWVYYGALIVRGWLGRG